MSHLLRPKYRSAALLLRAFNGQNIDRGGDVATPKDTLFGFNPGNVFYETTRILEEGLWMDTVRSICEFSSKNELSQLLLSSVIKLKVSLNSRKVTSG